MGSVQYTMYMDGMATHKIMARVSNICLLLLYVMCVHYMLYERAKVTERV